MSVCLRLLLQPIYHTNSASLYLSSPGISTVSLALFIYLSVLLLFSLGLSTGRSGCRVSGRQSLRRWLGFGVLFNDVLAEGFQALKRGWALHTVWTVVFLVYILRPVVSDNFLTSREHTGRCKLAWVLIQVHQNYRLYNSFRIFISLVKIFFHLNPLMEKGLNFSFVAIQFHLQTFIIHLHLM